MNNIETVPQEILEKRIKKLEHLKTLGIIANLEGTRIIIWEPQHGYALYDTLFFGKPLGIRKPKPIKYAAPYELSFYDAIFLLERGIIKIQREDKEVAIQEIVQLASQLVDDFKAKYRVYEDLREKGFVVKSGLKYGADFVVYVYGPGIDHSPFVVSVFSPNITLKGQDFLRSGRLSWSVRKRWVLACVYNSEIKYFVFEWNKDLSL